jgi:DUF1365 family protein
MPMDLDYEWRFTDPDDRLTVHMVNLDSGRRMFDATLALERRPVTGWQLARVLMAYPFMTAQVIAGIYWQALRLWWKGAPFYPHPQEAEAAAGVDTKTERIT